MKELYQVTSIILSKLENQCPNCEGSLTQKSTYKLQCEDCKYIYYVDTRNNQIFYWLLMVSFLSFVGGALLWSVLF
jgi:ribosomal protein S27AE